MSEKKAQNLFASGNTAYLNGDFTNALNAYQGALKITQSNPDIFCNLGSLYQDMGAIQEAEKNWKIALELNSLHTSAMFNLGMLLQDQKRFTEAIDIYKNLINIEPDYSTYANLGSAFHQSNQLLEAADAYRKSQSIIRQILENEPHEDLIEKLIPILSSVYENLGRCLSRAIDRIIINDKSDKNEFDKMNEMKNEALAAFKAAISLDPTKSISQHMLNALEGNDNSNTAPAEYVTQLFDDYSDNFEESLKNLKYAVPSLMAGELRIQRQKMKTQWSIALDLGCGTGLLADALIEHSEIVMGVDLSPKMLSKAEERNIYHHLFSGDMTMWIKSVSGWLSSENLIPKYNTKVMDEVEISDDGEISRRKSSGSIVKEVSSKLYTHDVPALATLLENTISLGPVLVTAADVLNYVGDLKQVMDSVRGVLSGGGTFVFTVEHLKDSNNNQWKLQSNGRFAHRRSYIESLAYEIGLNINSIAEVELRVEETKAVEGLLVVLTL